MVYPRSIKSPSLETSRLIEIITSDKADHSSRSSQVDNQTYCLMLLLLKMNAFNGYDSRTNVSTDTPVPVLLELFELYSCQTRVASNYFFFLHLSRFGREFPRLTTMSKFPQQRDRWSLFPKTILEGINFGFLKLYFLFFLVFSLHWLYRRTGAHQMESPSPIQAL